MSTRCSQRGQPRQPRLQKTPPLGRMMRVARPDALMRSSYLEAPASWSAATKASRVGAFGGAYFFLRRARTCLTFTRRLPARARWRLGILADAPLASHTTNRSDARRPQYLGAQLAACA